VAVAGVWAVAATAVALIALLDDDEAAQPRDDASRVAADLAERQRSLDDRLGQLERRVRDSASGEDLQRLDRRLQELEDDVSSASDAAADAGDAADALGNRVDDLESRIESLEAGGDGGDGGDGGGQP
jgi:septal ring factor EnvC (AmiA/AmiB activator)